MSGVSAVSPLKMWRAFGLASFFLFLICLFVRWEPTNADVKVSDVLFNPSKEYVVKEPTVFLAVLVRNTAHMLPHWLAYIENLDYPKDRMSIWIQTDHNEDKTREILKEWVKNVKPLYHKVSINSSKLPETYKDSEGPGDWSDERYFQIMHLRQKALDTARKQWADFIFFVDGDNFLINPGILRALIEEKKTVIAPMIEVFGGKSAYCNFWGAVDEDGYYARSDDYFLILQREKKGCFQVPMVHSTYLIDLRRNLTDELRYDPPHPAYNGEWDDILIFAHSAKLAGIPFHVLNKDVYGYMMFVPEANDTLQTIQTDFLNVKLEWFVDHPEELMPVSPHVTVPVRQADKMGFDQIYMINLKRRPLRRQRMMASLKELGIAVKALDAVDGKTLTDQQVKDMGIRMLPGYADPYGDRPLKMGEIGCFLSHYIIWEEMINNGLNKVLVLEDDVRFQPNFRQQLEELVAEADSLFEQHQWDLIYIGRKRLKEEVVNWCPGARRLNYVNYTYWTLGYIINLKGARKLISAKPLSKMVAVDEFLPIMYNKHPKKEWSSHFYPRNLVALTAEPLLLYPTHYVGDVGYFSDTETTGLISSDLRDEL